MTDEKKETRDSQVSDERYKTLFEQVNAAAFLTTLNGQILEANQKSCELLGYNWEELLRLSLKDILPRETDWSQFIEEIAARGGLQIETENMRKDGEHVPVELSISLFKMKGEPVMFVLIWNIEERKTAEKRLRESEKKYRGLFEYTPDGTMVLDARGDILDVNTKTCEIFDYRKEELVGKNLLTMDVLTAKSMPIVVSQFEQLLSEKTSKNYTTEIKTKDEKIIDVEISSFFLVKKSNEVDNFVLIIRDITDRISGEKKRIREYDLFRTLMDNIPDSVYFKDEQHRFVHINKAKALHSHIKPEEMIGKTDFDFFPHDQAQKAFDDEKRIMDTGEPIINEIEKLTHKDGSDRWISVTKVPWYDAEGNIFGTMGISRNITELKRAEEQFAEKHELLQTLIDNIPDSVYFKDNENRFVLVNKTKANHWNIAPEEMVGKNDFDFLPHDQAQKAFDDDNHIMQTGEAVIDKIEKITGSDGLERWFSVTKIPRYDKEGNIIGTMGISRNVTEWKRLEEMKKENIH